MPENLQILPLPALNRTRIRPVFAGLLDRRLLTITGIAFLLRLVAIVAFPSLHHADENYQAFEQAHRLAFGYGVQPWEFQDGIRSMVVPYLLGGVFALVEPVFGGPFAYVFAAQLLLAGLSVIGVGAVYCMGARTSRTHALLVGTVAATWFEMVYFSFRPLSEAISCDFLLVGLSAASVPPRELTRPRLLVIGFCAGLSLMLRIQLLPGLLFLSLWTARFEFRRCWVPLILGGAMPVLAFGAADWLAWGSPFHSFIQTVNINLLEGKASSFGIESPYWYVLVICFLWGGATPVILLLIGVRARRSALWIGFSLSVIAVHSVIPHKEYRFIFPALACLILVAAMGSADIVERARMLVSPRIARYLAAGGVAFWVAISALLAFGPGFSENWFRSRGLIQISFWLSAQPDLCGLMIYDDSWAQTGGYSFLHRDVPLYPLRHDHEAAKRGTKAFNFIILNRSSVPDFVAEYPTGQCTGQGKPDDVCVVQRVGSCIRDPALTPLLEQGRLGEVRH